MLSLFKKKKETIIYSPVNGRSVLLENVPDKVFNNKMMGDGLAFELIDNIIYAPCDGKIMLVADTLHAVGLKANNGAEILIHIGLDTVNLGGKGFKSFVTAGQKIKKGNAMIEINMNFMKDNNINLITPMIITNDNAYNFLIHQERNDVKAGESVIIEFK